MRRGYAVAWVAWEGDMLPGDGRMVLDVPVATDNGEPITGRVRVRDHCRRAGHHDYAAERPGRRPLLPPVAGHADAVLTRRRYPYDPPEIIPHDHGASPADQAALAAETQVAERALVPSDSAHPLPGRIPARLDLRTDLYGAGSEGDGPGPCRGARFRQLPEIRPIRRQSAARARRRPMAGAARRPGAACAISSIAASTRTRGAARVRWRACRTSPGQGANG